MTAKRTANRTSAADVDAYLATLTQDKRAVLQALRETIRAAAPGAEEGISYGMPAFRYLGRPLVAYAAFRTHCSLFGMSYILETHREQLAGYDTSKGTVRFTPAEPLPSALVTTLVQGRMAEIEAG
jgi:Uncharacterized conserved protein